MDIDIAPSHDPALRAGERRAGRAFACGVFAQIRRRCASGRSGIANPPAISTERTNAAHGVRADCDVLECGPALGEWDEASLALATGGTWQSVVPSRACHPWSPKSRLRWSYMTPVWQEQAHQSPARRVAHGGGLRSGSAGSKLLQPSRGAQAAALKRRLVK